MSRIEKMTVGNISVTALVDGTGIFENGIFPDTPDEEISALLAADNAEAIATHFNALLIENGDQKLLVDAGAGDLFGPTCGFLPDALAEAGVKPDDITHLLVTHMHADHVGGMLTPKGDAVFANATLILSEAERDVWLNGNHAGTPKERTQKLTRAVLAAYAQKTEVIQDGAALIKGATAMALPGHTPGHLGVHVADGQDEFMHVTDIVHAQSLQLANPDICVIYDTDPDQARQTRKAVLDRVASDGIMISGGHLMLPKFAKLVHKGTGYRVTF